MHRLFSITLFFFVSLHLFSQVEKDTVYFEDTIYWDRTVEKVVYVYGNPEYYWSMSLGTSGTYNFMQSLPTAKQSAYSFSFAASADYLKYNCMLNVGLQYSHLTRNIDKIHQSPHYTNDTYYRIDTLSWYSMEIGGKPQRIYITDSTERDTVNTSYVDSLVGYKNTYDILYIPIWFGYQLRYGFLSIDAKIGLLPGFCFHAGNDNIAIDTEKHVQAEKPTLSPFFCDVGARLQFRYMLTFNILLGLQIDYYYSVVSLNKTDGFYGSRYHAIGANISCSFLLNEKE